MRFIVLDLSSVPSMDTTATHIIEDFVVELDFNYKATLMLASPTVEVRPALSCRTGFLIITPPSVPLTSEHYTFTCRLSKCSS